jgi:hypothetical protein
MADSSVYIPNVAGTLTDPIAQQTTSLIQSQAGNNTPLTSQAVKDLLGFSSDSVNNDAAATKAGYDAQAAGLSATGYDLEGDAYAHASELSRQNETLALVSSHIQQTREDRQIYQSLSSQKAAVAASGFAGGQSALALYADSASQGALAKQLIGVQGNITANGYEQEAQASDAQSGAARIAGQAARLNVDQNLALQSSYQNAGVATQTNAMNYINQLLATEPEGGTAGGATSGTPTAASGPSSGANTSSYNPAVLEQVRQNKIFGQGGGEWVYVNGQKVTIGPNERAAATI